MRLFAQSFIFSLLISIVFLGSCHHNRPDPPDNWDKKANNQVIGQIVLDNQVRNCASTVKKHVICTTPPDTLENVCAVIVTYTDGTPRERWEKDCINFMGNDTLVFDDGQFTYFYGTKTNP